VLKKFVEFKLTSIGIERKFGFDILTRWLDLNKKLQVKS